MTSAADDSTSASLTAKQVDANVLQQFWDLASLDPSTRQKAATTLVEHAVAAQELYTEENGEDKGLVEGDIALRACAPLTAYIIRRLAKGLGSGREGARQGFAAALAQTLAAVQCVPLQHAHALLLACMENVTGSAKASEVNDHYFGQLFGLGAIARAMQQRATLVGNKKSTKKAGKALGAGEETAALELRASLVEALVDLMSKKSFLNEAGAALIVQLAEPVNKNDMPKLLELCPTFSEWMRAPPERASPETLVVLLRLLPKLPPATMAACPLLPSDAAGDAAAIFQRAHLATLLPLLKATSSSHPRLHTLWGVLLGMLVPGLEVSPCGQVAVDRLKRFRKKSAPEGKGADEDADADVDADEDETPGLVASAHVEAVWEAVVEQALVPSSHERKYLAFELFHRLLPCMDGSRAGSLLSKGFMKCLVNNLSQKDNYLHRRAAQCAHTIVQFVKKPTTAPQARVAVTSALQRFGGGRFDQLTGTSTVAQLLQAQDASSAGLHMEDLMRSFLHPEEADTAAQKRAWAVEQLSIFCRNSATDSAQRARVLKFMLTHAFFQASGGGGSQKGGNVDDGQPSLDLASDARERCQTRLLTLLAHEANRHAAQLHQGGKNGTKPDAEESQDLLEVVCAHCHTMEKSKKFTLVVPLEAEQAEARKEAFSALAKMSQRLKASSAAEAGRTRPFCHLIQMLLLHHLTEPHAYAQVLAELPLVFDKLVEAPSKDEASDEDAPHPMDVLTDVLLTLAAQPSAGLREAVERLFRAWCDSLTWTGVQDMLRVLLRGNTRQKARRKGERRGKGSGGEEDSEEDDDEDVLEMEGEESEGESVEEEVGQSSDEEESDEDEAAKPPPSKKPKAAAKKAKEATSDEDSEEDEADAMDDDAMFEMDALLGRAFKSARLDRTAAKATSEALVHFKFRTCTLLDIFMRKNPASRHVPAMLLPLLRALSAAAAPPPDGNVQLAARISGLISNGICKGKESANAMDAESLKTTLAKTASIASKSRSKPVATAAASGCHYLLRLLKVAAPEKEYRVVAADTLRDMAASFFTSKDTRLSRVFFEEAGKRCAVARATLLALTLPKAAEARTDYLRVEAASLGAALLRQIASQKVEGEDTKWVAKEATKLSGAVLAVLSTHYKKPLHHADALKAACAILELVPKVVGKPLRETVPLDGLIGALERSYNKDSVPKVISQQQRMQALLGAKKRPASGSNTEPKAKKQKVDAIDKKDSKKDGSKKKKDKGDKKKNGTKGKGKTGVEGDATIAESEPAVKSKGTKEKKRSKSDASDN